MSCAHRPKVPKKLKKICNYHLFLEECRITSGNEKHLDTAEGGSYIYISLFEGKVRLGKARQQPMGYVASRLLAGRRLRAGSSQAHETSERYEGLAQPARRGSMWAYSSDG
jgi:hypothetical protein